MKTVLRRLVPAVLMLALGVGCTVYDGYPDRGYGHRHVYSSYRDDDSGCRDGYSGYRGGYSSYRNGYSGYRGGYGHSGRSCY